MIIVCVIAGRGYQFFLAATALLISMLGMFNGWVEFNQTKPVLSDYFKRTILPYLYSVALSIAALLLGDGPISDDDIDPLGVFFA